MFIDAVNIQVKFAIKIVIQIQPKKDKLFLSGIIRPMEPLDMKFLSLDLFKDTWSGEYKIIVHCLVFPDHLRFLEANSFVSEV